VAAAVVGFLLVVLVARVVAAAVELQVGLVQPLVLLQVLLVGLV
jgi:hypothetical protein